VVAEDVTLRKNAEDTIRRMAHYDTLTELPNRILFSDRLKQALAVARRDKTGLAVMFLDLDKFKPINDTLGHAMGDWLLKQAARRMMDCMRESDIVCRIGGDEFVVLLPTIKTEQDALAVAEKIRHTLNQPFIRGEHRLEISSSTGVAIYPEHGMDEDQLLRCADIAMYHSKDNGRDQVTVYQPGMLGLVPISQ
jgi:diguanylate cyclase (GGDEF)-like protein